MTITIRKMQLSDTVRVLELLTRWNIAPRPPTQDIPHPERSELSVENSHVALDGECIIGVCSFIQHSTTLAEGASLALDPAYRGRHVAEKLLLAGRRTMYMRGIRTVRSESDRPETIRWLVGRMSYRIVGTAPKRHAFGLTAVDHWTVLELDLESLPELQDLRAK